MTVVTSARYIFIGSFSLSPSGKAMSGVAGMAMASNDASIVIMSSRM